MRFLRQFLLSFLGLTALYLAAVRYVDPRGQFGGGRFPTVFLNARVLKLESLKARIAEGPVAAVVLGSSRSMLLSPTVLSQNTGLRSFNLGLFAATAEDYLAAYRRLSELNPELRVVGLGIDPFTFVPGERHPDLEANWELRSTLDTLGSGFLESVRHAVLLHKGSIKFGYAVDLLQSVRLRFRPVEPRNRLWPDGAMTYPRSDREITAGSYDYSLNQAQCVPEQLAMLERSDSVSEGRRTTVSILIREAVAEGRQVVLWLTPSSPDLLAAIQGSPRARRQLAAARGFLREMATRPGVSVLDLSDPVVFSGDPSRWYDCVHMSPADADAVTRLIAARVEALR